MKHDYDMAWREADSSASPPPADVAQALADVIAHSPACHGNGNSSAPVGPSEEMLPRKGLERPFIPGQGTFFDEHIDFREPEGTLLTERIIECYDDVRPKKRKRGRDKLALRIRKLAANAMRGHYFRTRPPVLYYRGAAIKEWEDKPDWTKHGALGDVVDALYEAGLVKRITGKKMPANSKTKSWASSYSATADLVGLATACGITAESIDRKIPTCDLVQLYAPKGKAEFDRLKGELIQPRKGKRIWFEPTIETEQWTATLEAINAFYRQQKIALSLTTAELDAWLAKRNTDPDRKGAPYRLPEMFSTDLYRVFNEGDEGKPAFDKGGRLFGGWWMQIPESLRQAITIDGKPTIELDYSACHPRMLYHERGLDGEGELYTLPEITAYEEATGADRDKYRPSIKWLMQILINGRGRPELVEPPTDMIFPPDISLKQLVSLIEANHQPIADAFRTGAGLRLMRLEADIVLEIVTTAMAEGWTALSVHDSVISTFDKRNRLKAIMTDIYTRKLGKKPTFK